MESMPLELVDLLRALDEHGVDCVVIGGVAVGLHGHPRATKDLDIMIAPDPGNVSRLWAFIEAADAHPIAVGDFEERGLPLPFTPEAILAGGGNWLLRTRYGRLDVMQNVEGAPAYADLLARSEAGDLEGLSSPVRFCSLDDLLVMKRAAGRAVDLGDIERLEQVNGAPDD